MYSHVNLLCVIVAFVLSYTPSFGQSDDRIKEMERQLRDLDDDAGTHPFSTLPLVETLRDEAESSGNPRLIIMSNYVMSKAYGMQHKYDEAYVALDKAFATNAEAKMEGAGYRLNYRKGFLLAQQGESSASIPYFKKSWAIASEEENLNGKAYSAIHMGYAHIKLGEFDQAIVQLDKGAEILKETQDEVGLQNLYTYMGMYYSRTGEREKGIEQRKKALELSIQRKDTTWMITNHLNLLSSYAVIGEVEKAFEHYEKRDVLINSIEYPENRKIDLNVGVLYVQSEKYAKALEVLNVCQAYYREEGNVYRVSLIDHWKAIAYRGLDRYDRAAELSKVAYDGARSLNDKTLAELSAYTLFQTYHWRGNNTQAIEWLITSNTLKDSLRYEAKQKEMTALETKYETFRKEQEIEMLKAKAETERVKRNQLWLGLVSSLLIGGMLVYNQILRRRKEKEIQVQKLKNAELEQNKLKDKLHYKEKEMASQLLQMAQKNEFLAHINTSLDSIKSDADNENKFRLQKVMRTITRDIASNETWEQFLTSFKEIHHTFVDTLVNNYKLTANEVRFASMMKMNMTSKEIASLLNVSDEGVKKARYRLRKKLGLESSVNIQEYLLGMG